MTNNLVNLPTGTVVSADCHAYLKGCSTVFERVLNHTGTSCGNCSGTGLLAFDVVMSEALRFIPERGAAHFYNGGWYRTRLITFPCPVCGVVDRADMIGRLFEASGLLPAEHDYRLSYLDGMSGKEHALDVATNLLGQVPLPNGYVLFFGNYGVGKTGILKSLVAAMCRAGVSAKYATAADILADVRATFGDDRTETERAVVGRYINYQLLAIDELGPDRSSGTQWAMSVLFAVLDKRYARRDRVATVTAINYSPDKLAEDSQWKYFESRTRDGWRVPVGGAELRGRK